MTRTDFTRAFLFLLVLMTAPLQSGIGLSQAQETAAHKIVSHPEKAVQPQAYDGPAQPTQIKGRMRSMSNQDRKGAAARNAARKAAYRAATGSAIGGKP